MPAKIKLPSSAFVKLGYRFLFYLVANVKMRVKLSINFLFMLHNDSSHTFFIISSPILAEVSSDVMLLYTVLHFAGTPPSQRT